MEALILTALAAVALAIADMLRTRRASRLRLTRRLLTFAAPRG